MMTDYAAVPGDSSWLETDMEEEEDGEKEEKREQRASKRRGSVFMYEEVASWNEE